MKPKEESTTFYLEAPSDEPLPPDGNETTQLLLLIEQLHDLESQMTTEAARLQTTIDGQKATITEQEQRIAELEAEWRFDLHVERHRKPDAERLDRVVPDR
jgi:hypothetical protein